MLLIEVLLAFMAVLLAVIWPTIGAAWFERIERVFSPVANRRLLAVVVIGSATLSLRLAVLRVEPIPQPAVHDEFSYLLQADTFAHGRLTNPTPPMWEHFETFFVIQKPTYCGKYFPGQALFLSLGQVVLKNPFWGVWLTSGLMCAAITWMLQGWFSPGWAFVGGALALLRFGVFGYWADSYWGGNVAAIGGALVLGALPRIKTSQRARDALLMGIGVALLINSRPWEGFVLSLPVAAILLVWMLGKDSPPFNQVLRRVVLPLGLVVAATVGWLGYYCWRTTDSPFRSPYQVYEQTYGAFPYMAWQHQRPEPLFRHTVLRKLQIDQVRVLYESYKTPVGQGLRIFSAWAFFLGPLLTLPFLTLIFVLPYGFSIRDLSQHSKTVILLLIFFAAGTELVVFYNPHYSAPVTALIIAAIVLAMQRLRVWSRSGLFLTRAITVACVIVFVLRGAAAPLHLTVSPHSTYGWNEFSLFKPKGWFPRAEIQSELRAIQGDHLVIVRYRPDHEPFPDWVYNDADLEHAKIIWARDMGAEENSKLINYFHDRKAWLLEPDENPPKLVPYGSQSQESGPSGPGTKKGALMSVF